MILYVPGSPRDSLLRIRTACCYAITEISSTFYHRPWGGEYANVAILVALAVNEEGYREVSGAREGMKEDKESWPSFLKELKERGLKGTQLFVGDKCLGLLEAINEVYPEAKYQRWVVHFYRNVFSVTPRTKTREVAAMLKAIHAQENKEAVREKALAVAQKLREMKLKEAA